MSCHLEMWLEQEPAELFARVTNRPGALEP